MNEISGGSDDEPQLPPDFLEQLYSDVHPLSGMDFLPTSNTESGDIPPEPSGTDLSPWSGKKIYVTPDGTIGRGDYPSEESRMATETARERIDGMRRQREVGLAAVRHLNDLFADDLTAAQELLVSDFGERASGSQFHIVGEDDFPLLAEAQNTFANATDGGRHVIIGISEATGEAYGSPYIIRNCLAGGVMAAAQAENILLVGKFPTDLISRLKGRKPVYDVGILPRGNLDHIIFLPDGEIVAGASYLSQGYIASYATEGCVLLGATYDTEELGDLLMSPDTDRPALGYSHGHDNTPYIRPQTGRLMLPFRYLAGLQEYGYNEETDRTRINVYTDVTSIAALGFDLLDNRAPGLRQAMRALITNPDAREQVIGLIDSVKPGLYKELLDLQDDAHGYRRGTEMVLGALGLTDAPVGTGLDIY